jgi:hypothetical protein
LAVRAWLETAIPPVLGKEMGNGFEKANISNTSIGLFYGIRKLGSGGYLNPNPKNLIPANKLCCLTLLDEK